MDLSGSEWEDIVPIPQDDGPHPVVPIAYLPRFVEVMGYFRAVQKKGEISARALALTAEVIDLNAANYTAWHYRRLCLFGLGSDKAKELSWVAEMAAESPKNYQLWHHRRLIVDAQDSLGDELTHTAHVLLEDSKNYHVWSHRQWTLKRFANKEIWDKELAYIEELLQADRRNNSAWNQRHFVIDNTTVWSRDVILQEIQYASNYIDGVPHNESPWNYLEGLLRKPAFDSAHNRTLIAFAQKIAHEAPTCKESYSLLVELFLRGGVENDSPDWASAADAARKLGETVDTVREAYWRYRYNEIQDLRQLSHWTKEAAEDATD